MVASLIRDFVPEEWVRELDFSTLEKQNGSYVTDDLRERHDDIIWRIRYRDSWFYIYLLLEFQVRRHKPSEGRGGRNPIVKAKQTTLTPSHASVVARLAAKR
jgi:hypothetical protein